MNVGNLADILKRRDIKRVCYFHTDHFEPWSKGVNEDTARGVDRFAEMAARSRFSSRMSLFYHTFLPFSLNAGLAAKGQPGVDAIVFGERSTQQETLSRRVMAPLEPVWGHEVQIHVHHESWTRNTGEYSKDISRWVNANSTQELDHSRLDRALSLTKQYIANDIGRPIDRWAFIHGNWALNGSDKSICWIDDEIELLMKHGCFGDFTFPAGRRHCDPSSLEEPYTCLPLSQPKGYDMPEAKPLTIASGADPLEQGRFFIWNSLIKAKYSSLDYYSESNRDVFKQAEVMVEQWLENCVKIGDCLYIKTHAHSMKWEYEIDKGINPIPHLYPDIVSIFDLLERVCEVAGVPLEVLAVNDVMARLQDLNQAQTPADSPVESAETLTLEAAIDALGVGLVAWLDGSEERDYAAGDFYRARIKTGQWLDDYEIGVVRHILASYEPQSSKITEVGAGVGGLTLVLAALGYKVCAFEGDSRRSEGAIWLRDLLSKRYPWVIDNYQIIAGFYPDTLPVGLIDPNSKNILVTTNLVNSFSAKNQDKILRSAFLFDRFIVDVSRFGLIRSDKTSKNPLVDSISRHFNFECEIWASATDELCEFSPKSPLVQSSFNTTFTTSVSDVLECVTPVVRTWLDGLAASGLQDALFTQKFERGQLLDRREIVVATQMLAMFDPAVTRVVEVGSACGVLALFLAANGFDVIGFDGSVRRTAVAESVKAAWASSHPDSKLGLQFLPKMFPAGISGTTLALDRRNVLLATNIVSTYSAENEVKLLLAAGLFDEVVIDLGRLGSSRDSVDQRQAMLHALSSTHFEPQRIIYHSPPSEFWHFRVRPVLE